MITKIEGIRVGQVSDFSGITGCTVIIYDVPVVAGVDVRGANPSTRDTDLLRPDSVATGIHGLVLAGGSTFGLDTACGVIRFLEERGRGFDAGVAKIPIVPAAVIYDLAIGNPNARPNAEMGYRACMASTTDDFERGSVGAGTGATFGKLCGMDHCMKGGIGTSCVETRSGVIVSALMVLNAFGDVLDLPRNTVLAGARDPDDTFANTLERMKQGYLCKSPFPFINTVIGTVATNARLSKPEANRVATLAHNGLAKVISPAHTDVDGDAIFATGLAESVLRAPVDLIGNLAAEAVSAALLDAVKSARSLGGIPSHRECLKHAVA